MQGRQEITKEHVYWLKQRIDRIREEYHDIVEKRRSGFVGFFRRVGEYFYPDIFAADRHAGKTIALRAIAQKQEYSEKTEMRTTINKVYAPVQGLREHSGQRFFDLRLSANILDINAQIERLSEAGQRTVIQEKQLVLLRQHLSKVTRCVIELDPDVFREIVTEDNARDIFSLLVSILQNGFRSVLGEKLDSSEAIGRLSSVNLEPKSHHALRMLTHTLFELDELCRQAELPLAGDISELIKLYKIHDDSMERYHFAPYETSASDCRP